MYVGESLYCEVSLLSFYRTYAQVAAVLGTITTARITLATGKHLTSTGDHRDTTYRQIVDWLFKAKQLLETCLRYKHTGSTYLPLPRGKPDLWRTLTEIYPSGLTVDLSLQ